MKTQGKMKLIFVIAITLLVAKPVTAQAINKAFEKRILIPAKEVRIDSLLKFFSRQTGLEFSFNSNKISPSKKLSVPKRSNTLSQWLDILKEKLGAEHKLAGNHIILVANSNKNNTKQKSNYIKAAEKNAASKKKVILHAAPKSKEPPLPHISNNQRDMQPDNIQNAGLTNNTMHTSPVDSSISPDKLSAKEAGNTEVKNVGQTERLVGSDVPVQKSSNEVNAAREEAEKEVNKDQAIQLIGGYSLHGSGDMKGIVFGTEYTRHVSKKFSLNYNIRATINSGKDEFIVNNISSDTRTDASVRYTTAGVQLGANAGLSVFKSTRHDFKISLGAFGRYQSASNGSDGYSLYNPQTTGIPTILIGYDNRTAQETFAVGGIFQFQYDYTFRNKIFIGILPGFQTDTNGDAIPQLAFIIGRKL